MTKARFGFWMAEGGLPRVAVLAWSAWFFAVWLLAPANAQETEDPVELGREAFGKRSYPWYDSSKDAPRPLRLGKKTKTKSSSTSSSPRGTEGSSSPTSSESSFGFSLFGSGLQVLGLVTLTVLLVAVAALIVWAFLKNETAPSQGASVVTAARDVDRVEQLPFALKRTSGDFLAEAQRLAAAGNYSEAIIYLYSHLLVQLDRQHVIRLTKGKTNRQYLRETRTRPALAAILETTMVAFEDVFFGKHELSRERFEECHRQVGPFQSELDRLERQAA